MLAFFFITLKPGVLKEDFPQLLRTVSVVAVRGGAEGQRERSSRRARHRSRRASILRGHRGIGGG